MLMQPIELYRRSAAFDHLGGVVWSLKPPSILARNEARVVAGRDCVLLIEAAVRHTTTRVRSN